MAKLVFDIEGNGFYDEITNIWCIATKDIDTGEVKQYYGERIVDGVASLTTADMLIGHNIIAYDIPVLKKLGYIPELFSVKLWDTFLMSSLLNPDRRGGHGLEAWGKRFKRYKPAHEDWSQFSNEMLHRCTEDVEINYLTYLELLEEEKQ